MANPDDNDDDTIADPDPTADKVCFCARMDDFDRCINKIHLLQRKPISPGESISHEIKEQIDRALEIEENITGGRTIDEFIEDECTECALADGCYLVYELDKREVKLATILEKQAKS